MLCFSEKADENNLNKWVKQHVRKKIIKNQIIQNTIARSVMPRQKKKVKSVNRKK